MVASKLWVHEPDTFGGDTDTELREKRNFFVNRSVPKNGKIFWGIHLKNLYALSIPKKKVKKICWTLFWPPEVWRVRQNAVR